MAMTVSETSASTSVKPFRDVAAVRTALAPLGYYEGHVLANSEYREVEIAVEQFTPHDDCRCADVCLLPSLDSYPPET